MGVPPSTLTRIQIVLAADVVRAVREIDPSAVARPGIQLIQPIVEGQALQFAGGQRQDVDVAAAGARGDEGQLRRHRANRAGAIPRRDGRPAGALRRPWRAPPKYRRPRRRRSPDAWGTTPVRKNKALPHNMRPWKAENRTREVRINLDAYCTVLAPLWPRAIWGYSTRPGSDGALRLDSVVIDSSIAGSGIVKRRAWAYILGVGCTAALLGLFL